MHKILLLLGLCCVSAVTPVEKVVQLLKDLQRKVEDQGAKEAAQYDRYACFCKNQAEFKKEAIKKSEENIAVLEADITDLDAKIQANSADIAQLKKDISKLKEDIKTETEKREEEHKLYLVKAKDLDEAIAACDEAVELLRHSKKKMKGAKVDGGVDLAQLKKVVLKAKVEQSPEALHEALALMKTAKKAAEAVGGNADEPGEATAYQYQSNDIIATIHDLGQTFRKDKKQLFDDEHNAMAAFDSKILGYNNEKSFKEKEQKEKEALVAAQTAEKADKEKEKDDETADKESDEEFLKELESSCEEKAKDWDQRSKSRAEEMTALAEAEKILAKGAVKQYSVNKKLVGLVNKVFQAPITKVALPAEKPVAKQASRAKAAPTFLQLRNAGGSQAAAVQRVLSSLDSAASRLHSPVLAAIAMKVQLQEDHFVQVRSLIKDLIKMLEDQAKAEATTKGFCDTEMAKATNNRDDAALKVEEQNGIISKESAKAALEAAKIVKLAKEIAQLHKEMLEAEELRATEKANNEKTVEEAKAGVEAVKSALVVLKGFYGLVQTGYKPPKSDRYGETVADVAPETFEGDYKGDTAEGKGIIGILEVVQSDFERTVTETEKSEAEAVKAYDEYKKDAEKNLEDKNTAKDDAETAKEAAEQAVVQAKDDLFDAETAHENALSELDKLAPLCVTGTETYAERVAKREEEIAALKEAYEVLDNYNAEPEVKAESMYR